LIRINLTLCFVFFCSGLHAASLQQALTLDENNQKRSVASQERIGQLDDERKSMLQEYLQLQHRIALLHTDNKQLQTRIESQARSQKVLQQQLAEIEVTRLGILPLLEQMHRTLNDFVSRDLPFLPQERQVRLQRLAENMDRPEASDGERYRQLLEAYQVELEYGRNIEVYQGILESGAEDQQRSVNFFRLARIGLYYLTLDEAEAAVWDSENNQWKALDDEQRTELVQAMRIARNEAVPDFIRLPLASPQDATKASL